MAQIMRFACVGIINTLVDLGVLNALLFAFDVGERGYGYLACKAVSFSCAVANSYFMNKRWVFKDESNAGKSRGFGAQGGSFLAISLAGLIVNASAAWVFLSIGSRVLHSLPAWILWNGSALAGTVAVLFFNFLGYKHIVFRAAPRGDRTTWTPTRA